MVTYIAIYYNGLDILSLEEDALSEWLCVCNTDKSTISKFTCLLVVYLDFRRPFLLVSIYNVGIVNEIIIKPPLPSPTHLP